VLLIIVPRSQRSDASRFWRENPAHSPQPRGRSASTDSPPYG